MSRSGRIEAYIHALMKRAQLECTDGVLAATIPDAFGIVAMGATEQTCLDDLRSRLEDWVRGSLAEGETLPVIDGLDLNHMEAPAQATQQAPPAGTRDQRFFEGEAQLETALSRWEREGR